MTIEATSGVPTPAEVVDRLFARVGEYLGNPSTANLDALKSLFAADAEWTIPGDAENVPWVGHRTGPDDIAGFYTQ